MALAQPEQQTIKFLNIPTKKLSKPEFKYSF